MSQTWFLDHNAGAPVDPRVLERFVEVERDCPANPASLHRPGRHARAVLEQARERIAAALGWTADGVVFTGGGTEANNLAARGLGEPGLPVLLSAAEHPSVREAAAVRGTVPWAVDALGRAIVTAPDRPVGLLCLVHGQNEIGILQPVDAAAELASRLGAPLFVDAAQSLGRVPLAAALAVAAAVSLSPHKCGGLRGHGVLLVRRGVELAPLLRGGGQETGRRPGTQSPALAAANALAIELAVREHTDRAARMRSARLAFATGLGATGVAHRVLTPTDGSLPNTLLVHFADIDGRNLLPALDLAGVFASQGAACSAGAPTPSPLLRAMGLDDAAARACVRFSCGADLDPVDATSAGVRAGETIARLQNSKRA